LLLSLKDAQKSEEVATFITSSTQVGVWARQESTRAGFKKLGLTQKSPLVQFKWNSLFDAIGFQSAHEEEIVRAAASLNFVLPTFLVRTAL
jgi:hypothetical protein